VRNKNYIFPLGSLTRRSEKNRVVSLSRTEGRGFKRRWEEKEEGAEEAEEAMKRRVSVVRTYARTDGSSKRDRSV